MASQDEITKIINLELRYDDLQKGLTAAKNEFISLQKSVEDSTKAFKKGTKTQQEHAETLADVELKKKALTEAVRQYQKEILNNIKIENQQEGSLNSLRSQIQNLTKEYNAMGREMRNSAEGDKMIKKIAELQKEVSEAEIAIGNFRSRVGSYADAAQGFTKLNYAIQQVVRETPSMTHSITQYFLAISNNLPMLADEIERVRMENKALQAQGMPTVSVIKQIVTSLFSWQTVLVAVITLSTAFSDDIIEWVKGLFKGKDAVDAMAKSMEQLRGIQAQAVRDSQEEITALRLTKEVAEDVTRSTDERTAAIERLRSKYPEYLKNLSDEEIMNGKLNSSIGDLVKRIIELNKARLSLNKLVENEENLELLKSQNYAYLNLIEAQEKFAKAGNKKFLPTFQMGKEVKTDEYENLLKAQKQYLKTLESTGDEGSKLAEKIREDFNGDVLNYIDSRNAANATLEASAKELFASSEGGTKKSPGGGGIPTDNTADRQAAQLARIRRQTQQLADETFKIYTEAAEKTRREELRIFDETQARKVGVITQRQQEISSAIEAGVMTVNGKELQLNEELKNALLGLYKGYEEQKTQLTATGAQQRAEIEKKWDENALAMQEKANREEIQEFMRQMRDKEEAFALFQQGNQIEEQAAAIGGSEWERLSVQRINRSGEEQRAVINQQDLEKRVYSDLIMTSNEYSNAKIKAANKVAEAQLNLKKNEEDMKQAALQTAQESLSGFSALAGGFSQLAEAMGADAGVVRGMAIAQSALALAAGIAQAAMVPFPANLVAIATVLGTLATIITQVKQLNSESKSQQYAQGGLIPVSGNSGIIKGRSHASGGVAVSLDGRKVAEVEDGELLAVVNKKDTAQLRALSAINSHHGIKFADGGLIDFSGIYNRVGIPSGGSIIETSDPSGALQYAMMRSAMIDAVSRIRPQVAVRDITSKQKSVSVRDMYAKSGRITRKKVN